MKLEQEHSGSGDNIGGNKYELNYNLSSSDDIQNKLAQRINQSKYQNEDIGDKTILEALKDVVKDLIEKEQRESHQIVPIGKIRDRFKSLFDEDVFISIMRELKEDGTISIEDTQVCFLEKQTNYKINF